MIEPENYKFQISRRYNYKNMDYQKKKLLTLSVSFIQANLTVSADLLNSLKAAGIFTHEEVSTIQVRNLSQSSFSIPNWILFYSKSLLTVSDSTLFFSRVNARIYFTAIGVVIFNDLIEIICGL